MPSPRQVMAQLAIAASFSGGGKAYGYGTARACSALLTTCTHHQQQQAQHNTCPPANPLLHFGSGYLRKARFDMPTCANILRAGFSTTSAKPESNKANTAPPPASTDDELAITLWRGIAPSHPGWYPALHGVAVPRAEDIISGVVEYLEKRDAVGSAARQVEGEKQRAWAAGMTGMGCVFVYGWVGGACELMCVCVRVGGCTLVRSFVPPSCRGGS